MRSLSSIVASALAITSFAAAQTAPAVPAPSVPATVLQPILTLSTNLQVIITTGLASSQCNPADFPCICSALIRLNLLTQVRTNATAVDVNQYINFQASICSLPRQPNVPVNTTIPATPTRQVVAATGTGVSNVTVPVGPYGNVTIPATATGLTTVTNAAVVGTSTILVTSNGVVYPTVVVVGPGSGPGPAVTTVGSAPTAKYTGAAAAVNVPEFLSNARNVFAVGAMGFMGMVFAEL